MAKELERKFLVKRYPGELIGDSLFDVIHQTYLSISKNEELRVRKIFKESEENAKYTMTKKTKLESGRDEIEFDIQKETYDELLAGGNRIPLIKKRETLRADVTIKGIAVTFYYEIDTYLNGEFPQVVEVEFNEIFDGSILLASAEELYDAFEIPEWFGEEVTGNKAYNNHSFWKAVQK